MAPASPRQPSGTTTGIERWAFALLAALAVLRLVVAAAAPLSPDESYYWLWTRPVQLSYFDHPGMVAWWIWAGVHLFGDSPLGVRIASVLSSVAVTALIWDAARIAWESRAAGARAAIWLNATLLFGAAGVLMTPDAPLILFWTVVLWAMVRLADDGRARWLYVVGAACGLGFISKYTIGLMAPGLLATFLLFRTLRRWFANVHLWAAIVLALVCAAPVIAWNAGHNWASFAKQGSHAFAAEIQSPIVNVLDFLGGQLALATPLVAIFLIGAMGWVLVAGWRAHRFDWFLLGAVSLPPLLFMTVHALDNVVQAHWPGPVYLSSAIAIAGAPLIAGPVGRGWRSLAIAAPALGFAITLLAYLQATTAVLPIPPRIDPTKRLGGWEELAAAVTTARAAHPDAFLFAAKHETAGTLAFLLPDHPAVFVLGGTMRPPFYDASAVASLKGKTGILILRAKEGDAGFIAPYFSRLNDLRVLDLHWGGRVADRYRLTLAEDYKGGLFVEGDGFPGALDTP